MNKSVAILLPSLATAVFSQAVLAQDEPKPYTMDGELGIIVTTGNTETNSFKLKLTGTQELENWSNNYNLEGLYKEDEVVIEEGVREKRASAQKFFIGAQGNYKLENPDHRLFVFGSYEDDRFSNFDYQATAAAGWSQKVWETENSKFNYSVGPGYSFNKTQEGDSQDGFILRGSLTYEWNISETSKFTQFLSTEIGSDNTKSKSETAITANIYGSLAMKFSIKLDHNTDVADDRDNLDTESAVTLVYSFF